ncbi:uncharacterized protein Z520_08548 [Fonsecaea multimorphosa CBS 102226]|uniref:MAGE domain-containing protein n=1 Tax=Fonsecaea multimorphosa CBS 102226 TaxID=1442371 RepID=A0A0D2H1Z8_9EURO|nr:uncharacterized protein Z520_08548 [Fonsecaea multimorphosa CBS 102226]KIX95840.1 hypothetical protein Z520_08548 [Fonsecaea multimorphosa CBS 102226]OAL21575.1 hypothetical protein AYO22_07971 [Fonsecaea multimorphosa]
MPQRLKRRSDAISRDQSESEPEPEPPARRRATTPSESDGASSSDSSAPASPSAAGRSTENILIKKLIRLALATEYSRTPLRRSDISQKIFKDANTSGGRVSFKNVFEGAQRELQDVFGMQLMELPSKEKTTLKDRRTQATQTKSSSSNNSTKSWILVSTLPPQFKQNPLIAQPTRAPNVDVESSYTALYTFILSLIYLNNNAVTDQKLERYLKRVNADTYTPLGNKEKLLQRMMKDGYVERRRDTSSGEEIIEWTPGPRGKVEVGVEGVAGLVRTVYGFGAVPLSREPRQIHERRRRRNEDEDEEEEEANEDSNPEDTAARLVKTEENELNAKLSRSLGVKIGKGGAVVERSRRGDGDQDAEDNDGEGDEDGGQPGSSRRGGGQRSRPNTSGRDHPQGRGGGRRTAREDSDEDDD